MLTSIPLPSTVWGGTRRLTLGGLLVCLWIVVSGLASPAGGETIQPDRSLSELYLELGGQIPAVRKANGQRSPVPTRPGERIHQLTELSPGWIASGTKPLKRRGEKRSVIAGASDLLLIAGGDGPTRRLPVPRPTRGALRRGARPVEADGELVGLVWLEGSDPRSLAVMAADWTGFAWGPPQVISRPGPGSQIAASVAVTESGTWIAAWSRFDGRDDEIYWSQRAGANWTKPQRAHLRHAGPDIAPVVTAHGDGALLAWSRYEGDRYEAVLARWTNGRFLPPQSVGSGASAFPTFAHRDAATYLLYQNLSPSAWTLAELSTSGVVERRASHAASPELANRRPVVLHPNTAPRLSWPQTGKRADLVWETLR